MYPYCPLCSPAAQLSAQLVWTPDPTCEVGSWEKPCLEVLEHWNNAVSVKELPLSLLSLLLSLRVAKVCCTVVTLWLPVLNYTNEGDFPI